MREYFEKGGLFMNGEEKYLSLKGDLKYSIDSFRDSIQKRMRAAKYSFPIMTLLLILLVFVKSSDKVEILLLWACVMLILSAYLVLLEYFEKVWLDRLDEVSDRYDYYEEDEEYDYEEEEASAAEEKVVADR